MNIKQGNKKQQGQTVTKKIHVLKIKKKNLVTLRQFLTEDLFFFKRDVQDIYQAFYSIYRAETP